MSIFTQLVVIVAVVAALVQYRLSATGVSPVISVLPPLPLFPVNEATLTGKVEKIAVDDLVGPESLISTTHNGTEYMFASLGDGRIVRLVGVHDSDGVSWTTVSRTGADDKNCGRGGPADTTNTEALCGRPLGIKIAKRSSVDNANLDDDEDVLVVADAYKGLLMISGIFNDEENGGKVHTLATRANTDEKDYKFQLLNGIVQVPDGSIYISETTQYFRRRRIFHAAFDGRPTGRLLRYTTKRGVEVVAEDIYMANGLALSHDKQHILVVSGVQIWQYSLEKEQMEREPFVTVMAGTGDNIDAKDHLPNGKKQKCYWAGYGSRFAEPFTLLKALSEKPFMKSILCALVPYKTIVNAIPKLSALAVYGEDGTLIDVYQDNNVTAPWLSEAEQFGEYLYLASWYNSFLARVKIL
mmetsp:Transcript_18895/g.54460  ORF Transcript_18895/g.54460 Transcript_18895/m.54460 type:complete len:412 (-) Transcript_18895:87-1322(-)